MDGGAKREALCISAIIGIATDLEKHCVITAAAVRSLNFSISQVELEIRPSVTLAQAGLSFMEEVGVSDQPSFGFARSRFLNSDATQGAHMSFTNLSKRKLDISSSSDALGAISRIRDSLIAEAQASDTNGSDSSSHSDPSHPLRRSLVAEIDNGSSDVQGDQELYSSILASQTVSEPIVSTEESRRIESGQKASLALRPGVVLLKLAPPPVSTPRFSTDAWLYSNNDLTIKRTNRPSDASGTKLSEDQYYKYVNIDPSTLDAHVRACYRVYFGEQVSVLRPSGRVVPSNQDDGVSDATDYEDCDILLKARAKAKKPFLPYSSWIRNFYVNHENDVNSNDPFETSSSDPRTRFLIQFQSLRMKLLEHPDFRGVEPLFATAFVFSTGNNVGRRVCCIRTPKILSVLN
jgi:hypothetical protein